ncbi:segregation and condensation protein A [Lacticaseibacillus manihotivorans]|jgi:segregation and condensation protein A|uniref:Segregation and condensation protein A n=2 Tax=Lacticaseibacillus manihotivorans TaxID=88233 RepID=A0A0R1QMS7_9LACO|nr:segregation/condensation protein A [Lacticaseibacillus manihotivorans]KRL43972.1 segregation and condensation protein [Lacticaseibacillus manihotivorans DSM 13343 = JCM 12514]QFQ91273.1 segregation/condensation protein A [Lacticaseibacillus manihotivorans]
MALTLVLDDFSGPLDLLWHLIRTNEVDIYDIPIAEITSQYLDYLHQMQELSLDVAGDYFVMAASLMALKSQLLLPQPEVDVDDEEYVDPRSDLVNQLLTYQMYQAAAKQLQTREVQRAQSFAKDPTLPDSDLAVPMAPGAVKLRDLVQAMSAVVANQLATAKTIAHIEAEPISLTERIGAVMKQLSQSHQCLFEDLLAEHSVDGVVTTFLAILELMKNNQVDCAQAEPFAPITVTLKEAA